MALTRRLRNDRARDLPTQKCGAAYQRFRLGRRSRSGLRLNHRSKNRFRQGRVRKGYDMFAMDIQDRIVVDPAVLHGEPVIRGTRVPVSIVVGSLAGGMTFEDVQREYDLTVEDVRAALKFAADLVAEESFHPLPAA